MNITKGSSAKGNESIYGNESRSIKTKEPKPSMRELALLEIDENGLHRQSVSKIVKWAQSRPTSSLAKYLEIDRPDKAAFAHWCELVRDLLATPDYISVKVEHEEGEPTTYSHLKIEEAAAPDIRTSLADRLSNINGAMERLELQAKTLGDPTVDKCARKVRKDIEEFRRVLLS